MNRLSELRAEKNLKQEELAKILSVDIGIISRYERNATIMVNMEFENKVCDFFNCTLDYLRGRSNIRNEAEYSASLLRVSTMIKNFYTSDIKNKQMPSEEDIAHFEAFVLRFKELFQQLSSSRSHRQR